MNILHINTCVRKVSRTKLLADYLLKKLDGNVIELNLNKTFPKPLIETTLDERSLLVNKKDFSHDLFNNAKQFAESDIIVISAPYWDLSFPALLKCYIESINITGITFQYSEKGVPIGLCKAKKLFYITTSGGEIHSTNFGFNYIKTLSENFYGIHEIKYFKAECLDIKACNVESILNSTKKEIDMYFNKTN